MNPDKEKIKIGTMLRGNSRCLDYIEKARDLGFESFQIHYWETLGDVRLEELIENINKKFDVDEVHFSSLGIYGNPLRNDETGQKTIETWIELIDKAHLFGTDIVSGFTGRIPGRPVPDSIEKIKKIFTPICEYAGEKNIRIAFENCPMEGNWDYGDWNIAFCPEAWELLFEALPYPHVGLEWEPGHCVKQLGDPLKQIEPWLDKVFHVHGKDATVDKDKIRTMGVLNPKRFSNYRLPGYGDSNWELIIKQLIQSGFSGSIDIEGYHDPVYRKEREWEGQSNSLKYLKKLLSDM